MQRAAQGGDPGEGAQDLRRDVGDPITRDHRSEALLGRRPRARHDGSFYHEATRSNSPAGGGAALPLQKADPDVASASEPAPPIVTPRSGIFEDEQLPPVEAASDLMTLQARRVNTEMAR